MDLYAKHMKAQEQASAHIGRLTLAIVDNVYSSIVSFYDEEYGGFGRAPKFPQVDAIELALTLHQRTGDPKALEIVVTTLKSMAKGGIYDHEMGGFFRYSVTRDWSTPHFEKMLEDNARLLVAYLHAYQVTGDTEFRETAESIISYVQSTLYDREHSYFYGSQDADEKYYALPKAERANRLAPFVDTVAYTSWNAMMASAYLEAAGILERPELAARALAALRFLWEKCWLPGQGMCHYWDGEAHLPGLLGDQVWMAFALLHAYEYTAAAEYLQRTQEIIQWMQSELVTKAGSLQDKPSDPTALGRLIEAVIPLTENAIAAIVLTRIARLCGDHMYMEQARRILSAFAEEYSRYGYFAASYALALEHLLNEPLQVVVVGSADNAKTTDLLRAAWRPYAPSRTLLTCDPVWEAERLAALGYPPEPAPAAYICLGQTCAEPATDATKVISNIKDLYEVLKRLHIQNSNKKEDTVITDNGLQLIRKRRTIRKFTAEEVSEEQIEALLDAASAAPSRLGLRPLHYVVIQDRSTKNKIAEALRVRPYIEQAPVVIAVCGDPQISPTWELDGCAAIENMLLAATSLGLGGAWVGSKGSELWNWAVKALRESAAIPEHIDVVSLVCFGHPAEDKRPYEPGENIDPQRIHYDHWDNLRL